VISPLLANIFLDELLDQWFEHTVKPRCRGPAHLVRFADDAVLLFKREDDARRVLAVLAKRFGKYNLTLHPDKTRLVAFQRPPARLRRPRAKPATFDLLGFTHYWGRSRRGYWVVKRKTAKDRFTRSVRAIHRWCRSHRHWPLTEQWRALRRKLLGHYAYFGVRGNSDALSRFFHAALKSWRRWLARRSQNGRMPWSRFWRLLEVFPLPRPRLPSAHARLA